MNYQGISREVLELKDEVISLRRDFHRHPEKSYEEFRTSKVIAEYLKKLGLEVKEKVAKTGVVGLLEGEKKGKTILYRADMDALKMEEENDVEYRSQNKGVAHMCGHDAHMAVALTVAKILASKRDKIKGNVKFVFQPSEEQYPGGAKAMIDEGVMENPKVDAALGLHIWQNLPIGTVGIKTGPVFASSDVITLKVSGKGGHGAMPHQTTDPILISANIIIALQALVTRETDPLKTFLLTFGQIHGGSASNIIPEECFIQGTFRCFDADVRIYAEKRVAEISQKIAETFKAKCDIELWHYCPSTINEADFTQIVIDAAKEVVPKENILGSVKTMGADDISYFLSMVPGCYFFLGSSNKEKGLINPHHNPRFNIDEDALPIGVEIITRVILKFLNG